MLVKTNRKDKKGRDIYVEKVSGGTRTVSNGQNGVIVPNPLIENGERTLTRVGHDKGVKIPDSVFGRYKKPIGQQREEKSLLRIINGGRL